MKSFRELTEELTKKSLEADAYALGVEAYTNKETCGYYNPFDKDSKAYEEFENGYLDAEYVGKV